MVAPWSRRCIPGDWDLVVASVSLLEERQHRRTRYREAEARQLRDTYHYFGCEPGVPTFRYDIIDACLPKIFDVRSDITTKALAESGWAVVVNEQDENFKIQDLERKIFTPARNRVMCEALLKEAQKDPTGAIGKSIVFAVNQKHATNLTKIFNEIQPGLAVTSRLASQTHRPSLRSSETANALNRLLSLWTCCPPDTTAETYSTSSNATYLFSDRIYSDQGTRYSPIHFQERSYRVRKEKLFPSRFLRRRGVLRGEIRPLGRA